MLEVADKIQYNCNKNLNLVTPGGQYAQSQKSKSKDGLGKTPLVRGSYRPDRAGRGCLSLSWTMVVAIVPLIA